VKETDGKWVNWKTTLGYVSRANDKIRRKPFKEWQAIGTVK
jgi:hypothetical protein